MQNKWYLIGQITKYHGVQGEVVIKGQAEKLEILFEQESVFLEINKELIPFFFTEVRDFKHDAILASFEDIETIEDTKALINSNVYIPIENIKDSNLEDELSMLVGYTVMDIEFGAVGQVVSVMENTQQALLVIKHQDKESMIPFVDDIILNIDEDQKIVQTNIPEGLLDLNE